MSAPDDQSMGKCIKDLKLNNVKLVVRTCEQSYNEDPLKEANIDIKVSMASSLTVLLQIGAVISRWTTS